MTNHSKWKDRIDQCLFFGEVVQVLEDLGCPEAVDVGAAHLFFDEHERMNGPCVTVVRGRRDVVLQVESARWTVRTPQDLQEHAPVFINRLRAYFNQRRTKLMLESVRDFSTKCEERHPELRKWYKKYGTQGS